MQLVYKYFDKSYDLSKFVNDNHIQKEDIQYLNSCSYGYELFYWRKRDKMFVVEE